MTDNDQNRPIKNMDEWYKTIFPSENESSQSSTQRKERLDSAVTLARKSLERLTSHQTV